MNVHEIVWQEDILLRSQHLQHNDCYCDNQIKIQIRSLGSHNWGFLVLGLGRQSLNMGKLVISQAPGVLPDGSLFGLGGNTESLALDVPPNTSNVPVYLTPPLVTGNHIGARWPEQAEVLVRYTAYGLEVADSNAGEGSMVQVSCAWPDFRLLLGEQQNDQIYIKLGMTVVLDTTPSGMISLDPDFMPGCLHAHVSAYLPFCLKEVVGMLGHRGDTIAERTRLNGKVGDAEASDFMIPQLINRVELLLRHYLGLEQVHLEQLYRVLLTMLGDPAIFDNESRHPRLDSHYQRSDQGASFHRLMEAIRQILSMVPRQYVTELLLQTYQYSILVSSLYDHRLLGSASFVLAVSAGYESKELCQRLPTYLKVDAVEHTRQLVNPHLPGIRIRSLPAAPRQIPFHSNKAYLILEPNAQDVTQLERSGGFAFHISGKFSELELKFQVVRD